MPVSFHNTISSKGQTLICFEAAAESQDNLILEVFHVQNKPLAWWEVKACLANDMYDGSVKRACTNLFKNGLLVKDTQVTGPFGKPTYRYKLKK